MKSHKLVLAVGALLAASSSMAAISTAEQSFQGNATFSLGTTPDVTNVGDLVTVSFDYFVENSTPLINVDIPDSSFLSVASAVNAPMPTGTPVAGNIFAGFVGGTWHHFQSTVAAQSLGPLVISLVTTQSPTDYTVLRGVSATVSAVPEPSAYVLALAGFGVVGLLARRRKAVV